MSARPGLVVVILRCEWLELPPGAESFLRDIELVIDEIAVSRSAVEVFHAIDEQGLQDDRKDEEASDEDHRLSVSFLDEVEEESEEASHEEEGEEIGHPGIEGEGDIVVALLQVVGRIIHTDQEAYTKKDRPDDRIVFLFELLQAFEEEDASDVDDEEGDG